MMKMRMVVLASVPAGIALLLVCCVGSSGTSAALATNDGGSPPVVPAPLTDGASPSPAGASLALSKPSRWVAAGGQSQLDFTIARGGVGGALRVHVDGLPEGVSAADVDVADGASAGTLTLVGAASAVLGAESTASVTLSASSKTQDAKPLVVRVSGKPGALDVTFGDGGKASIALPSDQAAAIAVLPPSAGADAGKIVIAGVASLSASDVRIFVARYRRDGTLDPTFGDHVGAAATRLGYTLFDPGPSQTYWPTYIGGMKVDSKGRVVVANGRFFGGACGVELSRWTPSGEIDASFARFSGHLETMDCGLVDDLAITATDDVAVAAYWNEGASSTPSMPDGTTASIVQLFSAADGARQGAGYRVFLDTSGGEKTTRAVGIAVDASGRFVVSGAQCNGGWSSLAYACTSMVVRLGTNGQLDTTFGMQPGWTSFQLGTPANPTESFYKLAIDPSSGDVIAVGTSEGQALGTIARIRSTDGHPAAFGTSGSVTRDLLTGATSEGLVRPLVDSEARIVFVGNATTTSVHVVTGRALADGTPDASYGVGGIAPATVGGGIDAALDSDDRLYVAGYANGGVALFRFWP